MDRTLTGLGRWRLLAGVWLLIFCLAGSLEGHAEEEKIRVGYPIQPGLTEIDEAGNYQGYTFEYLKEIAQYTNWQYEFITPEGDINSQLTVLLDMLKNGEIDILGGLVYTDQLAEIYDYAGYNYGVGYSTLSVLKNNTKFNNFNFATFNHIRVVVVSSSKTPSKELEEFAATNGFEAEQIFCDTEKEMYELLRSGKADAALVMNVSYSTDNLRIISSFAPKPFYFAATKGNRKIVNGLNMALMAISEANPSYMSNLHAEFFEPNDKKLVLSAEEQEYIEKSPPLRVAVLGGKAPIQYVSKDGNMKGISCSVLDYISQKTGLNFKLIRPGSYDEYLEMLDNHEVDMVAGVTSNYELAQEHQYTMTIPYVNMPLVIVINERLGDPSAIEGKRLALPKGIEYGGEYKGVVQYFDSIEACIEAVSRGEADYCYVNSYSAQYYISSFGYKNLITLPQSEKWAQSESIGVLKPVDITLLSILNKTIRSVPEESSQQFLYDNAFSPDEVTFLSYVKANPAQAAILAFMMVLVLVVAGFIWYLVGQRRIRKQRILENERYEQLSELSNEFLYEYDIAGDRLKLTDQSAEFLNCGKTVENLSTIPSDQTLFRYIRLAKESVAELNCVLPDGSTRWLKIISKTIEDSSGKPTYAVGKLVDVQQEHEIKIQLIERAQRDSLTRVYNAATIRQMVTAALADKKPAEIGALFIMDVDNFKGINDRLGHYTGDLVLQSVAKVLLSVFSQEDLVGRLGGDEFIVYMRHTSEVEQVARRCEEILQKVRQAAVSGHKEKITLSIGVALTLAVSDYDRLYRRSDAALYVVKNRGRNGYEIVGEED